MGAHDFTDVCWDHTDPDKAYHQLVQDALFERGHDPYNGTISTTHGWTRYQRTPVREGEARRIVRDAFDNDLDRIEKWGPALAIPLLPQGKQEQRQRKLTLDADEYFIYENDTHAERDRLVRSKLKPLKGFSIIDWRVTDVSDVKTRIDTRATEGEREARYFLEGQGTAWEQGYATQSEARAAAERLLSGEHRRHTPLGPLMNRGNKDIGIYAVTRRSDGSPLALGRRRVKGATLTVSYDMEQESDSNTIAGWLFFGLAAS